MAKGIDTSAMVAAFVAKGGTVKELPAAERTMTEKDVWQARTGSKDRIRERHFVTGSNGIEHCRNGEGEWIY